MLATARTIRSLEVDPRSMLRGPREALFASRSLQPSLPFQFRRDHHLRVVPSGTHSERRRGWRTATPSACCRPARHGCSPRPATRPPSSSQTRGTSLEVTEAGARCRQRRAGQGVGGDCSDGCQFGLERFGGRSVEVLQGEVGDLRRVALGHQSALLGETVQSSFVGLAGELQEGLHVSSGIPSRPPIGSDPGHDGFLGVVESGLLGDHIPFDSAVGHLSIVPATLLLPCHRARARMVRVGQGRRSRPQGKP